MEKIDITWLEPIRLRLSEDDDTEKLIVRLKSHIKEANISKLDRSVYIIRMAGSFVVAYPRGPLFFYDGKPDPLST